MKSMTPDQLLAKRHYAVIRVDENGNFRWMSNTYVLEGSALSDIDMMSENIDNDDHYEIVVIDHMNGDLIDANSDTDALHARAFRALIRYMFSGLRQMDEQLDFGDEFHAYRDLLAFAEGYLASAGEEISPIVEGVDSAHHVPRD
jgi:hypothetical protein